MPRVIAKTRSFHTPDESYSRIQLAIAHSIWPSCPSDHWSLPDISYVDDAVILIIAPSEELPKRTSHYIGIIASVANHTVVNLTLRLAKHP